MGIEQINFKLCVLPGNLRKYNVLFVGWFILSSYPWSELDVLSSWNETLYSRCSTLVRQNFGLYCLLYLHVNRDNVRKRNRRCEFFVKGEKGSR